MVEYGSRTACFFIPAASWLGLRSFEAYGCGSSYNVVSCRLRTPVER
jgi:hypothetical protein